MCIYMSIVCTYHLYNFYFLQIVQEYERAVIFRLGRVVSGGAKGPGKMSRVM